MKSREERVVGGVLKPSAEISKPGGGASMFEDDEDTMDVIIDKGTPAPYLIIVVKVHIMYMYMYMYLVRPSELSKVHS